MSIIILSFTVIYYYFISSRYFYFRFTQLQTSPVGYPTKLQNHKENKSSTSTTCPRPTHSQRLLHKHPYQRSAVYRPPIPSVWVPATQSSSPPSSLPHTPSLELLPTWFPLPESAYLPSFQLFISCASLRSQVPSSKKPSQPPYVSHRLHLYAPWCLVLTLSYHLAYYAVNNYSFCTGPRSLLSADCHTYLTVSLCLPQTEE